MSILTYPLGFIGGGDVSFYNGVIENSLRFNQGDGAYLRRSFDFSNPKCTMSWWMKYSGKDNSKFLDSTGGFYEVFSDTGNPATQVYYMGYGAGDEFKTNSPQRTFRDPAAWMHVVKVTNGDASAESGQHGVDLRNQLYINGERVRINSSSGGTGSLRWAAATNSDISASGTSSFDGCMADMYFIEGHCLGPENFGEWKNGVWIPKEYSGAPPLIVDSSIDGDATIVVGSKADGLDFERYYIGNSSIGGAGFSADHEVKIYGGGDIDKYAFPVGTDWTFDFWIYPDNDAEAALRFGKGNTSTVTGSATTPRSGTGTTWYSMSNMYTEAWGAGIWAMSGGGSWQYWTIPASSGPQRWNHISYIRHKGGTEVQVYHNGILIKTVTASDDAEIDDSHFAVMDEQGGNAYLSIGRGGSTSSTSGKNIWIDELRLVKGEALPPRFYFGTNYGDEDGGRLAQRATTADRFVDDERTTLLISGQSANNHARTVSVVDESGFHRDNVHYANNTYRFTTSSMYPTTDGVGKQFAIYGPQQTTKESFIGNTSSILINAGTPDYIKMTSVPGLGAQPWQIECWWMTADATIADQTIMSGDDYHWGLLYKYSSGTGAPDILLDLGNGTSWNIANARRFGAGLIKSQKWHHIVLNYDETEYKTYLDGKLIDTLASTTAIATTDPTFLLGIWGNYSSFVSEANLFDEVRMTVGSIDRPQIKWTHTQTAGAGNKGAYSVDHWRVHGHEFSDDNATQLLIHGESVEHPTVSAFQGPEAAYFGGNAGNSPNNGVTVWLGGDAAATRDTLMVACWFQSTATNLQYLSRFGDSVGSIAVVQKNMLKVQYGATTGWNVPCSDGNWHLVCVEYGNTADDIIAYFDGQKVYSELGGTASAYMSTDQAQLLITAYDTSNSYDGLHFVAQWACWTHDAADLPNYMVENGVPMALYNAGPTANWKTATGDYSSTYAGHIRHYYAFGNQNGLGTGNDGTGTAHADTTSTVYDRAAAGSSYAAINLTGYDSPTAISSDGVWGNFKDSSSANSIVHAVVSGGGAHHSKAVTLQSDGTNGTSTTDQYGNTILWCGSNATVTYANSSTFSGYGNTSISVSGSGTTQGTMLQVPDSADWDFTSTDCTLSGWIYVPTGGMGSGQYPPLVGQSLSSDGNWKFHLTPSKQVAVGKEGVSQTVSGTGVVNECTWHHMHLTWDDSAGRVYIYIDAMLVHAAASDQFNSASTSLGIGGGFYNSNGYVNHIMILKGEMMANRFYLGNQTAASVTTTSNVKYADFNGTNTESSADRWTIANITGAKLEKWSDGQGSSPVTANTGVTWATWANPDVAANDNIVAKVGGSRMYLSSNDAEWAFGAAGGSNVHSAKNKVGSWDFVVGVWKQGTAKFYVNGIRAGGHDYTSSSMNLTDSGEDGQLSIGGSTSDELFFDGQIAQFGVWNWELSPEEIMELYNLGIKGNWSVASGAYTHNTSTYMQGYYAMGNHDAVQSSAAQTGGTADTVALIQDRSGNDNDAAQATTEKQPALSSATTFYEAKAAKRLVQAVEPVTTSYVANNHYANVKAQSVLPQNFGGFVDDEYTMLLVKGGRSDGSTVIEDNGVSGGKTITFPPHSHSYGKTRIAKTIAVSGATHHEVDNSLGLYGSSIYTDSADDYWQIAGATHDFEHMNRNDFTLEFFFRTSEDTGGSCMWEFRDGTDGTLMYFDQVNTTTVQLIVATETAIVQPYDGSTINDGNWHHIAIQRRYNVRWEIFYDGVESFKSGGGTMSNRFSHKDKPVAKSTIPFRVGENYPSSAGWSGSWDDFRISSIIRYTIGGESVSGIIPPMNSGHGTVGTAIPTTPYMRPTPFLPADGGRGYFANSNVKLWVKSDSYPGDISFSDDSGLIGQTAKLVESTGHTGSQVPQVQTGATTSALSGGSDAIYFDGDNDQITIPFHKDLTIGNDLTVECWFRQTYDGTNDQTIWSLANDGSGGSDNEYFKVFVYQSGHIRVNVWKNGVINNTFIGDGVTIDAWHHVVLQRNAGLFSLFLDGFENSGGTAFSAGTEDMNTSGIWQSDVYIGAGKDNSGFVSDHHFKGYIDEFRWSKIARYTDQGLIDSNYPNPSTEFGIQTEGSTYGRFDTQVTANTTYQRYNYQHHDGWKSYVFDGTNDAIAVGGMTQTGTLYTVYAAWFQTSGPLSAQETIIGSRSPSSGSNYGYWLQLASDGRLASFSEPTSAGWNWVYSKKQYDDGEWHLGVMVHDGTTSVKLYADGSLVGTQSTIGGTALNGDLFNAGFMIGRQEDTSYFFPGRIAQVGAWKYSSSSALTTKWTDAAHGSLFLLGPDGNWKTDFGTDMEAYFAMGNHDTLTVSTADTAATVYDRSGEGNNGTTAGTMAVPSSDTKMIIHPHATIDGDTSIVDSSLSKHIIDRLVEDPKYANATVFEGSATALTRSSVTNGEMGIRFDGTDTIKLSKGDDAYMFGTDDFTVMTWHLHDAAEGDIDHGIFDHGYYDTTGTGHWGCRWHRSTGIEFYQGMKDGTGWTTQTNVVSGTNDLDDEDKKWRHLMMGNDGSNARLFLNGTSVASAANGDRSTGNSSTYFTIGRIRTSGTEYMQGFLDQIAIYKGAWLGNNYGTHISGGGTAGSRPGNTAFGTLGGLILHEEYQDGTNTANAVSTLLLHSNNATHHTHGSRKFYNDIANTRFTTTTGHEAAGRFTIGASSGIFTVLGAHQTGYSPAMNNPSIRLRRGYTYIFSASSLSSHKFYFANSSANTAGSAYGADTGQANEYITGLYGTNSTVDGTETWTAFSAGHFLGGNGTTGQWNHIKFEVPTNAPKDLYYRCSVSGHQAMGNAAYIMEATEPAPLHTANTPTFKTSTWNDRDYVGIGTNKSVIHLDGNTQYLSCPDDGSWDFGTGNFVLEAWIWAPSDGLSGTANRGLFGNRHTDGNGWELKIASTTNSVIWYDSVGTSELFTYTGHDFAGKWTHLVCTRVGTGSNEFKLYLNGLNVSSATLAANLSIAGANVMKIGAEMNLATGSNSNQWEGFMDEVMVYKGIGFNANTVIEHYQAGRAGRHNIANASCVLHLKADSIYGATGFTDSSAVGHTITNKGGAWHHIDDNRTANTALYFDGDSFINGMSDETTRIGKRDFTWEAWVKADKLYKTGNGVWFSHWESGTNAIRFGLAPRMWVEAKTGGSGVELQAPATSPFPNFQWVHVSLNRHDGRIYLTQNGIVIANSTTNPYLDYTSYVSSEDEELRIGMVTGSYNYPWVGWMDGIRATVGFARYTAGIPTDGQTPSREHDDGRSSNTVAQVLDAGSTTGTRKFYGINTHTYLQTTQYATGHANTKLMVRGDDAETANDGVYMYGKTGFHLEFKDAGEGTERDYNNFNVGPNGLGSDTSMTSEFSDTDTSFLLRSRPNQANGSHILINEVTQSTDITITGDCFHSSGATPNTVFSIDSNTANVSISSGGTKNI